MKENRIILGSINAPLYTFSDAVDPKLNIVFSSSVDVVGAELSIDVLTPVVDYPYTADSGQLIAGPDFDGILSGDGYLMATNKTFYDLRLTPYGAPVQYERDGELLFKGYVKNIDRIGKSTYKINAISAIGILETQKHYGGVYRGVTFSALLAEIIDGAVDYTVDGEVAGIAVYGWLPYATKRANLHQLLFATGVSVRRNGAGDMDFRFLSNAEAKPVPESRIYINGSVDYSSPASQVRVTEHSYMALAADETVVVYDNTDGSETADHTFIAFRDAPLHNLTVTGTLTVNSSGVNWAIVTGTGVLSGQKYTHSTRILTKDAEAASGQTENVVTVSDATLVTVVNSENVAKRVLAYYSSKKTVTSSIVLDGERPGDLIAATDPFDEAISGFISRIDANVSSILKGDCRIITDYIPSQGGNNFTRALLYSGSGSIDFAALVADKDNDLVQAVLIGGGHGGYHGGAGTAGEAGGDSGYGSGGAGGAGGEPGEGGKVFTVSFHASDLASATLAYACGSGGGSDSDGGATTLGSWSSENGAVTIYGVANIFTGEVYATKGNETGQPGAAGGSRRGGTGYGESLTYNGRTYEGGAPGADSATYYGHQGFGGSGGGAAVGAAGSAGTAGTAGENKGHGRSRAGNGGAGATAAARTDVPSGYGVGGNGGHGGGGGGGGGTSVGSYASWPYSSGGAGGAGGPGGAGSPGLLMILI